MRWAALLVVSALLVSSAVLAAPKDTKASKPEANAAPEAEQPVAVPIAPPAYFPDLLELSEVLGTLVAVNAICPDNKVQNGALRSQAEELITSEGKTSELRNQLIGRFNRGYNGYAFSHKVCTPGTRKLIERKFEQARRITSALSARFNG